MARKLKPKQEKVIRVTNSGLIISPYTKYKSSLIESLTAKYDPIYHKMVPVSGFYDEDTSSFSTYNMDLSMVHGQFPNYEVIYEPENSLRKLDSNYSMKDEIEFTETQNHLLAQSLQYLQRYHKVFINVPPGTGKTLMTIELISQLNAKSIIYCYSSKVLSQWESELDEHTDIRSKNILILESSATIEKIRLGTAKADISKIDIFLLTPKLADSYCKQYGWDKLNEIYNILGIGVQVIDEAHRRFGSTIRINAHTNPRYHVYLSADFNQANYENRTQFFKAFRDVPVVGFNSNEMEKLRHIKAVVCEFDSAPDPLNYMEITGNKYHWDLFKYVKYQHSVGRVYGIVRHIITKIIQTDPKMDKPYKVLVLLNMMNHVDDYTAKLKMDFPNRTVGRYHSQVPDEEKQQALDADIIVSTYQSFSTGVNIIKPNIRHCISTAPVDIVSNNQAAGRCRQIEGMWSFYWMIVDLGFEYCVKNLTRSLAYLQKSKIGSITTIEMDGEY